MGFWTDPVQEAEDMVAHGRNELTQKKLLGTISYLYIVTTKEVRAGN